MKNEIRKRLNQITTDRSQPLQLVKKRRESIRINGMYGRQLDAILKELYGKAGKVKPDRENAYTRLAVAEEKKLAEKHPVLGTRAIDSAIGFLNTADRSLDQLRRHQEALGQLLREDVPPPFLWQAAVVLAGVYYAVLFEAYDGHSEQDILALFDKKQLEHCLRTILTGSSDRAERSFYLILGGVLLHQRFAVEAAAAERFEQLSSEGRECYQDAYEAFKGCEKVLSSLGLSHFTNHGNADKNLVAEWEILYLYQSLSQKKFRKNALGGVIERILSRQERNPFFIKYREMSLRLAFDQAARELVDLICLEKKLQEDKALAGLYANAYKKPLAVVQGQEEEKRLKAFYNTDVKVYCRDNSPLIDKYRHLGAYYTEAGIIAWHKEILDPEIQKKQQATGKLIVGAAIDRPLLEETLTKTIQRHRERLDELEKEAIRKELQQNLGRQIREYLEPFRTKGGKGLRHYKNIVKCMKRPDFDNRLQQYSQDPDLVKNAVNSVWDSMQPGMPQKPDFSLLLRMLDVDFGRLLAEAEGKQAVNRSGASAVRKPVSSSKTDKTFTVRKEVTEYTFPVVGSLALCIFISFNLAVIAAEPAGQQAFVINVVIQSIILGAVSLKRNLKEKRPVYDLIFLVQCMGLWGIMARKIMESSLSPRLYTWSAEEIVRVNVAAFCEVLVYGAVWLAVKVFAGSRAET